MLRSHFARSYTKPQVIPESMFTGFDWDGVAMKKINSIPARPCILCYNKVPFPFLLSPAFSPASLCTGSGICSYMVNGKQNPPENWSDSFFVFLLGKFSKLRVSFQRWASSTSINTEKQQTFSCSTVLDQLCWLQNCTPGAIMDSSYLSYVSIILM